MAKWVANIGRRLAQARLAHVVCELGIRSEQAGLENRTHFVLPATQEQPADALGLTAVHVNRTLQELRKDGVLGIEQRTFRVRNWKRLASVAKFDPHYLLIGRLPEQEAA